MKKYKHDCDECIYLYTTDKDDYDTGSIYDVYFCEQGGIPTVIARYGNDGSEYMSGLGFNFHVLKDAEEFAKNVGLLN